MVSSVFLIITLMMPADQPDIRHQIKEQNLEQCWSDAKEFVAHGVPSSVKDAVGVMAGCAAPKDTPL